MASSLKDACIGHIVLHNLAELQKQNLPVELLENIINKMPELKKLNDSNIHYFGRIHNLDLSNNFITDIGLQRFAHLSHDSLRWANLSGLMISDESVCLLAQNNQTLEGINLSACFDLTDRTLIELSDLCPNVSHINIGHCNGITDDGVAYLAKLPNLQSLNLAGCTSLNGSFVDNLVQSPVAASLEYLNISACIGISPVALRKLVRKCHRIRTLVLSDCTQLQNEDIQTILKYSKRLESLAISNLPALTNDIIKFFMTWINVNVRLGRATRLRRVELIGNKQLDIRHISLLAEMASHLGSRLEIIGGQVEVTFLRNNSALVPIVLSVDRFTSIDSILKRLVPIVNQEEEDKSSKVRWSYGELSIQAVSYRNNGTKRPARMIQGIKRDTMIVEIIGQRKNHLYLQQAKRAIKYDENFVVLTLKRWDPVQQKPIDLGDYSFSCAINLRQLKQQLVSSNEFGVRNVPVGKLLLIEEETNFKLNVLLNDNMMLSEYQLVTGDIIHLEEIDTVADMAVPNEERVNAQSCSKTAKYLLAKKSAVIVEETVDSFKTRVTNWMYMPKLKPMTFEIEVAGTDRLEDLQRQILVRSGLEVSKQQLATRVDPEVLIVNEVSDESPRSKQLSEVLRGNQWLLLSVQM